MGVGFFNYFNKGKGTVAKTITGMKPKTKLSEATQTFKKKVEAIDKGLKKGIDDFKSENPTRQMTDAQMEKVRSEKKKELVGKETQAFIREKKRKGERVYAGFPARDIKDHNRRQALINEIDKLKRKVFQMSKEIKDN